MGYSYCTSNDHHDSHGPRHNNSHFYDDNDNHDYALCSDDVDRLCCCKLHYDDYADGAGVKRNERKGGQMRTEGSSVLGREGEVDW